MDDRRSTLDCARCPTPITPTEEHVVVAVIYERHRRRKAIEASRDDVVHLHTHCAAGALGAVQTAFRVA